MLRYFLPVLGDSDTGSDDSFKARTTMRDQELDGHVPFHPSDRSPNAGLQNLGSVSIFSNISLINLNNKTGSILT